VSLTSPSQLPGRPAPSPRPDLEALLLEAVQQRNRHDCVDWVQRCVHRRGLRWLADFQTDTLPARAGTDAAGWLAAVLAEGPLEPVDSPVIPAGDSPEEFSPADDFGIPHATHGGLSRDPDDRAWIEQRASAAVDGAIASMLAEFPELALTSVHPLGLTLPLPVMPAPPDSLVPDVLPGRQPPPVFSMAASHAVPVAHAIDLPADGLPGDGSHAVGSDGMAPVQADGSSGVPHDPDPLNRLSVVGAAPWQRTAAQLGAGLGSRLLRRFSQTDWRALTRRRRDPEAERTALEPPMHGEASAIAAPIPQESLETLPLPVVPEFAVWRELSPQGDGQAPEAFPAAGFEDHTPWDGGSESTSDPLAQMVRLAEGHRGQGRLDDAAPAPPALADLRAWLPEAALPRAS